MVLVLAPLAPRSRARWSTSLSSEEKTTAKMTKRKKNSHLSLPPLLPPKLRSLRHPAPALSLLLVAALRRGGREKERGRGEKRETEAVMEEEARERDQGRGLAQEREGERGTDRGRGRERGRETEGETERGREMEARIVVIVASLGTHGNS